MVRSQRVDDVLGTPSDVALGSLHYFLLELEELRHFVLGGRWMCGVPSVSGLLVTANWHSVVSRTNLPRGVPCLDSGLAGMAILLVCLPCDCCGPYSYCTYGFWSASYSCFACDFCYVCDSCYVPCSYFAPYPVPVPIHAVPGPQTSLLIVFAPFISGIFLDRGNFRVGLWRVLACLRCSPSSREDCRFSKCCWHWQSKSLTEANGKGIQATVCTGMLPIALACLA